MRKVRLSRKASQKLENLLQYLETQWSEKVKQDFIKKLDKSLNLIQQYPEIYEKSDLKKGLYRCVVTKQTSIYYQYSKTLIKVIAIFDTRMDPQKLQSEV